MSGHGDITEAIAEVIRRHLGDRPEAIRPVRGHRSFWEVRLPGRAVMFETARRWLSPAAEAWAYRRAAQVGVPVPEVLAVERHAESFPDGYLITTWLPGTTIWRLDPELRGRKRVSVVRSAGRILRLLHRITAEGFWHPDEDEVRSTGRVRGTAPRWSVAVSESTSLSLLFLQGKHVLDPQTVRFIQRAVERSLALLPEWTESRLVHGDFNGNVLVDPDVGSVTGVLDFEHMRFGDPVYDFAVFAFPARLDLADLAAGYGRDPSVEENFETRFVLYQLVRAVEVLYWGHLGRTKAREMQQRMDDVLRTLKALPSATLSDAAS